MPENCTNCKQKFEIEPGFWIGSLWTSYPLVVFVITPFILLMLYIPIVHLWVVILGLIFTLLIFYSLILRIGRSIWIHIFIKYDPTFKPN